MNVGHTFLMVLFILFFCVSVELLMIVRCHALGSQLVGKLHGRQ